MYGRYKRDRESTNQQWRRPLTFGQLTGVRNIKGGHFTSFDPTSGDIPADWKLLNQWIDPNGAYGGKPVLSQQWQQPNGDIIQYSYSRPLTWGPVDGSVWIAYSASANGSDESGSSGPKTGQSGLTYKQYSEGLNPHEIGVLPDEGLQLTESERTNARDFLYTSSLKVALYSAAGLLTASLVNNAAAAQAVDWGGVAFQAARDSGINGFDARRVANAVERLVRLSGYAGATIAGGAVAVRGSVDNLKAASAAMKALNANVSPTLAKRILQRAGLQGGRAMMRFHRPYKMFRYPRRR